LYKKDSTEYADSFSYDINGKPNKYPENGSDLLFSPNICMPTLENSFGVDVPKDIDIIFNEIGCDGVFWDEMEYSGPRYHYGKPWDGCTGIINPSTHEIENYRSSIILLSQPWRVKMFDRIFKDGKLIVGNTNAQTETMTKYHFPRFAELVAGVSPFNGHLYTPIAYGNSGFYQSLPNKLEERTTACYREMVKMLDTANLYYWTVYIEDYLEPSHKMFCGYMFPFTPIELHKGYVIGKERIITAVSGKFGWGDKSRHEVHVFNDTGVEVEWKTKTIEKDNAIFTEISLPEYYSAVILRK
ncbi:MAG: hypothetical protein NT118_10480, partial [Lentisphaerae bacterium]|nr:hypothetical protein [Lentisphaerota bacterium]